MLGKDSLQSNKHQFVYKIQEIKKHGYAGKGLQAEVGMRWMGEVDFFNV